MSGKRRAAEQTKDTSPWGRVLAAAFPPEDQCTEGGAEGHLPCSHFPTVTVTEHTRQPPTLPVRRDPPPPPSLLHSLILKIKRPSRRQLTPKHPAGAAATHLVPAPSPWLWPWPRPPRGPAGRGRPQQRSARPVPGRRPVAHLPGSFPPLTAAVELLAAVAARSGVVVHRGASAERPALRSAPARGGGAGVAMAAAAPRI